MSEVRKQKTFAQWEQLCFTQHRAGTGLAVVQPEHVCSDERPGGINDDLKHLGEHERVLLTLQLCAQGDVSTGRVLQGVSQQ